MREALVGAGLKINDAESTSAISENQIRVEIVRVGVEKIFGGDVTPHGRYFKMHSDVELTVSILDASGKLRSQFAISGTEDEPPAPVGAEIFLPLETEPADSLSVAISRAAGAIAINPQLRAAIEHPNSLQ